MTQDELHMIPDADLLEEMFRRHATGCVFLAEIAEPHGPSGYMVSMRGSWKTIAGLVQVGQWEVAKQFMQQGSG